MTGPERVLAHGIADKDYQYQGGYVGVNMHCEHPDGTVQVDTVWFPRENLPDLQSYFMSPRGMEPLELVI